MKLAAATGRRLKVAGGRSRRDDGMAATEGVQIVLDNYRRLLRVDRARGLVTVQAGATVGRLSRALAGWGLALDDPVAAADRSVGGAISTGSHGRGARSSGPAGWVTGLDLVLADGSRVGCSPEEEPEIFDAARVGLGALGVISSVTLRCLPGFNLRSQTRAMRLDDVLEHFDDVMDGDRNGGDRTEFFWIPRTGLAVVTARSRTEDPAGRVPHGRVDRVYRVRPAPIRLPEPVTEYSVPRACAVPILEQLARRRIAIPAPVRVSVSAADSLPLSPAAGRPSVFIGVGGRAASVLEELLSDVDGARPVWGTRHRSVQTASALRSRYPQWDAWQAVRRRLDPEGRFANAWTERVLGPPDQTRGQG